MQYITWEDLFVIFLSRIDQPFSVIRFHLQSQTHQNTENAAFIYTSGMPSQTTHSCEKDAMKAVVLDPDLTGKVILITGGTGGIGAELVVHLSHLQHAPARIIFTGRNITSANAVIERSRAGAAPSPAGPEISFIPMDLSSLESVSTASTQILALLQGDAVQGSTGRLDILLANAGIMATPPGLSPDGYEIQFATNHLGHALLIRKLMPLMLETAAAHISSDVRIVVTSSTGWRLGKMDDFPFEQLAKGDLFEGKTFFAKSLRYGNSKLANLVYARELAARFGDGVAISGVTVTTTTTTVAVAASGGGSGGGPDIDTTNDSTGDANGGNDIHQQVNSQVPAIIGEGRTTKTGKGILSLSIHPGVVGTGLVNDLPWADKALIYASQMGNLLTPEEGIRNHLWAITAPRDVIVPGAYYEPVGKLWSKSWSRQIDKKDPDLGRKMWEWTEEQLQRWL
ncbi:hypothetical protein QBC37DRAFT_428983 [Rhypophila decipiens]|uniref:Oxidoreductase n=1 Tax=Rhypophila decipiens TaxID=261697 RepID=A0AAN6Y0F1_9PEZI|nr:hypothetical protein QBC37DRAFT_428983 [Rhypophila decipiens]